MLTASTATNRWFGSFPARLVVYGAFVLFWTLHFARAPRDDLSASYLACRLLSQGGVAHIYDYDPSAFHQQPSRQWRDAAREAGFTGWLHPYIQIPSWARALAPLCTRLSFDVFGVVLLIASLVAFSAMIELCARAWASKFLSLPWLVPLLLVASAGIPFRYALWLGQTQPIVLALAVAALIAADAKRPRLAGISLGFAAALKLTPGLLVVYWFARRQYRACVWAMLTLAAVAAATLAACGAAALRAYGATLSRLSNMLLVSFNNESFAAFWAYGDRLRAELYNWHPLPMPRGLELASAALSLSAPLSAGGLSRGRDNRSRTPAAACLALVGITVFSTTAWTHYYIVLVPALMVLVETRRPSLIATSVLIALLGVPPFSVDPRDLAISGWAITRAQFFAACLTMIALGSWLLRSRSAERRA
jgi:hypothetical protein